MRIHTMLVGVGCLVIGLLASAFTPRLTAQTTPEPCQAPWDVVIGSERAVKSKHWLARREVEPLHRRNVLLLRKSPR